ncbi:MAG: ABC transporter ATP-binding protein [Psychrobium sp.]|nr:ABC transporter ATP-binding protein [Psychrobium sp.]
MSSLITINGLNKSYGKKQVLNDINLTISAGQVLGLIGPNGAGKSTCLQALLGLTSFEGDIEVLGHNPKHKRHLMLQDIAYINDTVALPKWIRVDQAIEYVGGVHPKFNRQKALDFLAKTNVPLNAKVSKLSKGMVTQVHLALILAIDVKVLVLDEPTLGLDILTRREFYNNLVEEFYDQEKAVIITTHQIEEIEHILTDVAFIKQGEIVVSEPVEQLKSRFKLVAVTHDQQAQAYALKPLAENKLMGMSSFLFDGVSSEKLAGLGHISTPSLADVFTGLMQKPLTYTSSHSATVSPIEPSVIKKELSA